MSSSSSSSPRRTSILAKKFVSESEIEAQRQLRREELRAAGKDPDADTQDNGYGKKNSVDFRSLSERLADQRQQQADEKLEQQRMLQHVHLLDDDEVDFLDQVERQRIDSEIAIKQKDALELQAFRRAREEVDGAPAILPASLPKPVTNKTLLSLHTNVELPAKKTQSAVARQILPSKFRIVRKSNPENSKKKIAETIARSSSGSRSRSRSPKASKYIGKEESSATRSRSRSPPLSEK